jgi:hypothetical protein
MIYSDLARINNNLDNLSGYLLSSKYFHHSKIYRIAADSFKLQYVDLVSEKPDHSLIDKSQYEFYITNLTLCLEP